MATPILDSDPTASLTRGCERQTTALSEFVKALANYCAEREVARLLGQPSGTSRSAPLGADESKPGASTGRPGRHAP